MPTRRPSSGSLPSYSEIAQRLALRWCDGGSCPWYESHHRQGTAREGVLHWSDRRATRQGLRRFLKLAAVATFGEEREGPPFVRLYWENKRADLMAAAIGVRLPRGLADLDRDKVRLWMSNSRAEIDPALRRRIQRWAKPR